MKPVLSLIAFTLILLFGFFYVRGKYRGMGRRAVPLKSAATLSAAALALCFSGDAAGWLLAAGILVGAAADALLEFRFLPGVLVFLSGHLLFIVSFCLVSPPSPVSALLFAAVAALGIAVALRNPAVRGKLLVAGILYASVIAGMLALALPLVAAGTPRGILTACGALFFTVSDAYLAAHLGRPVRVLDDGIILTTYYGAQFLLACSLVF